MDKIEQLLKSEYSGQNGDIQPDVEALIAGAHSKIKKRAIRRKTIYSSPVVVLLVLMGLAILPEKGIESMLPGDELLMAGWETSWTETHYLEDDSLPDDALYEQTINYIIDESLYSYSDISETLLDDEELEAFIGYLTEA